MGIENNPVKAKQESRSVDFKSAFDPDLKGDWCELIKDLVAMANSGGGTILIGVDDNGKYAKNPQALKVLKTDPSVITDKVAKYTGAQFDAFTVNEGKRFETNTMKSIRGDLLMKTSKTLTLDQKV